jgi:hypothetical protein
VRTSVPGIRLGIKSHGDFFGKAMSMEILFMGYGKKSLNMMTILHKINDLLTFSPS